MDSRLLAVLTFLLLFHLTGACFAQSTSPTKEIQELENNRLFGKFRWVNAKQNDIHEVNFIGGYSFHSTKGFWGKIPEARLSIYSFRYNRKLFTFNDDHLVEYVAELNISANYTLSDTPRYSAGSFTGWGITPFGFQMNLWRRNGIQPFFKSSAGFMHFSKPFPDHRGVKFNFTLELGGGLEFMIAENLSFSLGYKYHHMSNGRFGDINPGIDSNVFYSGFTIF